MEDKSAKQFLKMQQEEMDAYDIYLMLGKHAKVKEANTILTEMAYVELHHANYIKSYTNKELKSNAMRTLYYRVITGLFGLPFTLKLLEKDEEMAAETYKYYPELASFSDDESQHEKQLISLINDINQKQSEK